MIYLRRLRSAVAAAGLLTGLIGASLIGGPEAGCAAAAQPGIDDDPAVLEAEREQSEAAARMRSLEGALDDAAAAYEHAAAHHQRLLDELEGTDRKAAKAQTDIDRAQGVFNRRMIGLFQRPYETLAVAGALVSGQEISSVLHGAALLEYATTRGALAVERARVVGAMTADSARQHHVVTAGAAGAAAERQAAAEALTAMVNDADRQLFEAQAAVGRARADASRRLAERRAAEEAARRAREEAARLVALPGGGQVAPPGSLVDGKSCPIGAPNGFIDSWGFPRSGGRRHKGVDIFAAHGMPLYAVTDGTIQRVGTNRLGGLSLYLVDERGDRYYYAHLSSAAVVTGQRVRAGEVVGANGDSGNARGGPPHLHWEYHPAGGEAVNPYPLAMALCRK